MDAERWQRIGEIFATAADRSNGEREAFLKDACRDDTKIRVEVDRLLRLDAQASGFLSLPAADAMRGDGARGLPLLPPDERIGAYRLLRMIQRGGMGVVYLASRDDGHFERLVAIKLIRANTASGDLLLRFRHERQVLASLEHPHIARMYDGGVSADGRPYLVMEFVDGQVLNAFCAEQDLDLDARLNLMLQICQAVQYAHQNLIVHRDLKPGNILVTRERVAKLLDFGIAKQLGLKDPALAAIEEEEEETVSGERPTKNITEPGRRVMTPVYASPEQVRGEAVTTASDVYALGVLLFELLTDELPYRLGRSSRDLRRAVCEEMPRKPSQAVATGPNGGHRRRRLRGDLDAIVLKALRKKPDERYGTVRELAEDLQRHLDHYPVRARQVTFPYRLQRFLRRHRVAASAAALTTATLAMAGVAQIRHAALMDHQRAKAVQVSEFLIGLFSLPGRQDVPEVTVLARQLLDQGAKKIVWQTQHQPEIRAALFDAMGQVYSQLGLAAEARPLLDQALDLRRKHLGANHYEIADSQMHLASVLVQQGELEAAEAKLRQAMALRRATFGDHHSSVAAVAEALGALMWQVSRHGEAEALFREALEIRQRAHGPEHLEVAESLGDLAELLRDLGRLDEATPLAERSLALRRRALNPRHPDLAFSLDGLADLRRATGELSAASELYREALSLRQDALGDPHPLVVRSRIFLARNLGLEGHYEEGIALFQQAIATMEQIGDSSNPELITARNNLAVLLTDQGDLETAEVLLRRVWSDSRRLFGDDNPSFGQASYSLARVLHLGGDLAGAEPLYESAAAIADRLPEDFPPAAYPGIALGHLLLDQGNLEAAEARLRRGLQLLRASHAAGHWRIADAQSLLGACLVVQGQSEEGEPLLRTGLDLLKAQRGLQDPRTRRTLANLEHLPGSE